MKFLDGTELNKLNNGITHITLFIPPSNKPKDVGFFKPIDIIEFKQVFIGIYKLKN